MVDRMPNSTDLFEMRRLEDLSNTIFGVAMTLLAYRFPTGQFLNGAPVWSTIWSTYGLQRSGQPPGSNDAGAVLPMLDHSVEASLDSFSVGGGSRCSPPLVPGHARPRGARALDRARLRASGLLRHASWNRMLVSLRRCM